MISGVGPRWDFLSTISGLFCERRNSAKKKLVEVLQMFTLAGVAERYHTPHR